MVVLRCVIRYTIKRVRIGMHNHVDVDIYPYRTPFHVKLGVNRDYTQ